MLIREHRPSDGKGRKPMPVWARIVSALLGILLVVVGVGAFVLVRPLGTEIIVGGVAALGAGLDLTGGALSGRWPIVLQWGPFV
jgi:hypothetical protein